MNENKLKYTVNSIDSDLQEKYILQGCSDGHLRIYNVENNEIKLIVEFGKHCSQITNALFCNNGELIASSDFEGNIIVWKLEGTTYVPKIVKDLKNGPIYDIGVRYEEDSLTVFAGCESGVLKILKIYTTWNIEESEIKIHKHGITAVSVGKSHIVVGCKNGDVFSIEDQKEKHEYSHGGAITGIALMPDNGLDNFVFVSCSEDGKIHIRDKKSEKDQEIDLGSPIYSVKWSKPGFIFTVGYGDGKAKSFIAGPEDKYKEVELKREENA